MESFKVLTLHVKEEMVREEATDQELQEEIDYVATTEEEVSDARVIIDYKQKEWQEEKEKIGERKKNRKRRKRRKIGSKDSSKSSSNNNNNTQLRCKN